jgi:hypothetical protein
MNEQLKKFYKDNAQVKSVSLSTEAKSKVKTAIFANLKNEPQIVEPVSLLENFRNLFLRSYVVIPLALILLVGGTTIVSADSIPGDILYPVKRKVEDVRLYVAPTNESRSELEIEFSKKRIEESEKLRSRQKKINKVEIKDTGEEEDAIDGVNEEKNNNNDNSSQRTKDDKKSQPEDRARQIQIRANKDAEEALERLEKFQRKFEEEKREERSEELKFEIEQYKKQQELIEEQRKEALQEDQDRESEEDNSNQD